MYMSITVSIKVQCSALIHVRTSTCMYSNVCFVLTHNTLLRMWLHAHKSVANSSKIQTVICIYAHMYVDIHVVED